MCPHVHKHNTHPTQFPARYLHEWRWLGYAELVGRREPRSREVRGAFGLCAAWFVFARHPRQRDRKGVDGVVPLVEIFLGRVQLGESDGEAKIMF